METINLTAAFVVTQLILLVIIFLGMLMLSFGRFSGPRHLRAETGFRAYVVGGYVLASLGVLIFSDDLLLASKPVFGDVELIGFDRSLAFLIVFLMDLVGAAYLIAVTGGARKSPFSSVLFILPTIAIFLREPPLAFLSYAFAAAALFVFVQANQRWERDDDNPMHKLTFNFVTLCCLALSTMVGYVTRPIQ